MSWMDEVTNDTAIMLKALIEKKQEVDKYKKLKYIYVSAALVLAIFLLFNLYMQTYPQYHPFSKIIEEINYPIPSILIVSIVVTFFAHYYFYRKHKKEKDKYDNLRLEVIDHLRGTWDLNMKSDVRDEISEYMQENHDINVTYKTK